MEVGTEREGEGMPQLTEERLREMLADCESATPGPWAVNKYGEVAHGHIMICVASTYATTESVRHIANLDPTTAAQLIRVALAAKALIAGCGVWTSCVWCNELDGDDHLDECKIAALARELEDTP